MGGSRDQKRIVKVLEIRGQWTGIQTQAEGKWPKRYVYTSTVERWELVK